MSAVAFFNSARAYKRELTGLPGATLSQEDVRLLNAATVSRWKPAEASQGARTAPTRDSKRPTALHDAQAFYKAVRGSFGSLSQEQVDGFGAVLQAIALAGWPIAWAAYGLATAYWETARTMQPVREAYWLSEDWRRRNLKKYYPHYGRGYVQITWPANYERADEELGLNGALVADLDLAMRPDIAAQILVKGMEQGWFTGKKLADYLPISGEAGHEAFKQARQIINGTDKNTQIAKLASSFQSALKAGGWR